MRSGTYAIVFILVLILAVPTNLVDANNEIEVARVPDTSAEISPNITITGYVADVSNNEWNQALPEVTVSLLDSSMIRVSSTVTEEQGSLSARTQEEVPICSRQLLLQALHLQVLMLISFM